MPRGRAERHRAEQGRAERGRPGPGRAAPDRLAEFLDSEAGRVLAALSVYREPVDRNAVLFQAGRHEWTAADGAGADSLSPPHQAPDGLAGLLADCVGEGFLTCANSAGVGAFLRDPDHVDGAGRIGGGSRIGAAGDGDTTGRGAAKTDGTQPGGEVAVDRRIAGRVHQLLTDASREAELAAAHRRAAQYWQWRAAAWPQDRHADIHDMLEARQHLLLAGDLNPVGELTEVICAQLRAWGDLAQATELIRGTLEALPSPSAGRARWLCELAATAQGGGDYAAAERLYQRAVRMSVQADDLAGAARGHESLGVLAQARGEYRKAERHYRAAADAERRCRPGGTAFPAPAADHGPATGGYGPAADHRPAPADHGLPAAGHRPALADYQPVHVDFRPAANGHRRTAAECRIAANGHGHPANGHRLTAAECRLAGSGHRLDAASRISHLPAAAGCRARDITSEPPPQAPDRPADSELSDPPELADEPGPRERRRRPRDPFVVAALAVTAVMVVATGIGALHLTGSSATTVHGGHGPGASDTAKRAGTAGQHRATDRHGTASTVAAAGVQGASAARLRAADWVLGQVKRGAVISCDPAMCALLHARGMPAGDLLALGPGAETDPLGSDIVVATAAVRSQFGARLAGVYAPLVAAAFGKGSAGIEIRITAPDGAVAYRRALRADALARAAAGAELLRNKGLSVTPAARRPLADGLVDSRTLATIAALAGMWRIQVLGFGDGGPGAGPMAPLRSAELTVTGPGQPGTAGTGTAGPLRGIEAYLRAQQSPYLAADVSLRHLPDGQAVLRFVFAAPCPLGLLAATGSPPEAGTHH